MKTLGLPLFALVSCFILLSTTFATQLTDAFSYPKDEKAAKAEKLVVKDNGNVRTIDGLDGYKQYQAVRSQDGKIKKTTITNYREYTSTSTTECAIDTSSPTHDIICTTTPTTYAHEFTDIIEEEIQP